MEMFDYQLWVQWFQSLDRPFLFLLILPFVVAVVALWSKLWRSSKNKRGPSAQFRIKASGEFASRS